MQVQDAAPVLCTVLWQIGKSFASFAHVLQMGTGPPASVRLKARTITRTNPSTTSQQPIDAHVACMFSQQGRPIKIPQEPLRCDFCSCFVKGGRGFVLTLSILKTSALHVILLVGFFCL